MSIENYIYLCHAIYMYGRDINLYGCDIYLYVMVISNFADLAAHRQTTKVCPACVWGL